MHTGFILLLSGPIAAGKSTLSKTLIETHGFKAIRSGQYLQSLARSQGLDISRSVLQKLGDDLDEKTDFSWLIDDVAFPLIEGDAGQSRWLLDSVRKPRQVEHFRARFGSQVFHVHVVAAEHELRRRYEQRLNAGGEYEGATSYDDAIGHPNEQASRGLVAIADLTVDSSDQASLARVLASVR